MEKLRQAMESALETKWAHAPSAVIPLPAVRRKTEQSLPRKVRRVPQACVPQARVPCVTVSKDVFERNRLVAAIADHVHRDAYSVLRANVVEQMTAKNFVSLGVTSPETGVGKTLTAINLAISIAIQASRRVLLLDLDLENPNVHSYFEHEPLYGLEDCLFENKSIDDVVFSPAIDGLAVLAVKGRNRNATQILNSEYLRKLLDAITMADPDRIVVVNLPAIDGNKGALAGESLVDSTLLVVEDVATTEAHLRAALESICNVKLLGTVLNKTETGL
jgi:Mrp family chromosome partitioning ATPase